MLNPVIDESIGVYFKTRPYRILHAVYIGLLALATCIVWPARGYMEFFGTEAVPAAFEALAVLQLMFLTGVSMYAGMDKLASSEIIRYSEWLEHTRVSIAALVGGKIGAALGHTTILVLLGAPFLVISAGPGGIPIRAVLSTQLIILLVALFCRVVGMLISLIGEQRDVVRIVGSWVFLAVLFLATIQVFQPLNPIIAVTRQQNEASALVSTVDPVPFGSHPAVASTAYLLAGTALAAALIVIAMHRRRVAADRRSRDV